jgi:hypothetical protein
LGQAPAIDPKEGLGPVSDNRGSQDLAKRQVLFGQRLREVSFEHVRSALPSQFGYDPMRPIYTASLLALFLCSLVVPLHADTDGYFCVSKGYIAVELRAFKTAGLKADHVLRLVRFGPDGIAPIEEIALNDFGTERMECGQDHVELSGWNFDNTVYEQYSVDISTASGLRVREHRQSSEGWTGSRRGFDPRNIEFLGPQPQPMNLDSADSAHTYQLVVKTKETTQNGDTEIDTTAQVRELDLHDNVIQHVLLYEYKETDSPDGPDA